MSHPSCPIVPASEVQILETSTLLQAMETINNNAALIALVVDSAGKLLGTLTDGDIRRGIVTKGLRLESIVKEAMQANPQVMCVSSTRQQLIEGMQRAKIKQMPLLSENGTLVGIVSYEIITGFLSVPRSNPVVIMAGGGGKRMWPLTRDIPKPMQEIHGRPMLEHIIEHFVKQGFSKFYIAVNYLGNVIEDYFGNGQMMNCHIQYIREEESLGTAGALSLISEEFVEPFFVVNGDVLSSVDFCALLNYHIEQRALATFCVEMHRYEVPFGVVKLCDNQLETIVEKPVHEDLINAGIYVLEPHALSYIPKRQAMDMPNLLQSLVKDIRKVAAFTLLPGDWMDVGRVEDLVVAKKRFSNNA